MWRAEPPSSWTEAASSAAHGGTAHPRSPTSTGCVEAARSLSCSALRRRGGRRHAAGRAARSGASFIADGGDGHGEAAAGRPPPGRRTASGSSATSSSAARRPGSTRTASSRSSSRRSSSPAGPSASPSGRSTRSSARSSPGTCSCWRRSSRQGCSPTAGCAMLALPPGAAAIGGLAFAIAPYRLAQSGAHLLGLDRHPHAARPARLRARAGGRAHAGRARLGRAERRCDRLDPALRAAAPGARRDSVHGRLRRRARRRPLAAAWAAGGLVAAVGVGLAIHLTIVRDSAESEGRSLAEVGEFSGGLGRPRQPLAARRAGAVRLRRLAPSRARGRRRRPALGGAARALAVILGDGCVRAAHCSPSGRTSRSTSGSGTSSRRCASRGCRAAHADRRPGARRARRRRRGAHRGRVGPARGCGAGRARSSLVAADLLVFPLDAAAADPGNAAYAALRDEPEGRVLELPLFEPGIHYGSVYDYYQLQAPRERPGGYSTLVPQPAFDFYFLRNRLSCGVWLPGDEETLDAHRHPLRHLPRGRVRAGRGAGRLVRLAGAPRPRLLARGARRAGHPVHAARPARRTCGAPGPGARPRSAALLRGLETAGR